MQHLNVQPLIGMNKDIRQADRSALPASAYPPDNDAPLPQGQCRPLAEGCHA